MVVRRILFASLFFFDEFLSILRVPTNTVSFAFYCSRTIVAFVAHKLKKSSPEFDEFVRCKCRYGQEKYSC